MVSDARMHETSAPEAETRPTLSVIVPCFNEEAVIAQAHERLTRALASTALTFEIVYVDDGSTDRTALLLRDIQAIDPRTRVIRLSRNFGHQIAVTAGLDYAEGDAVIMIDADMQDPPELIPAMIAKWREGFEVVYGVRTVRPGESMFKRWTAHTFYRLINSLSEVPLPVEIGRAHV
jgi:dolichol-phosphate mannosyltransferase